MHIIMRSAFALLLVATSIVPATAQSAKLVWINGGEFYSEKSGIPALVTGQKLVEQEFRPRVQELAKLAEELRTLRSQEDAAEKAKDDAAIARLRPLSEKLAAELAAKQNDANAAFARRRAIVLGPIIAKVTASFPAYAAERKYDAIADATGQMLFVSSTAQKTADATMDFILWYNARPSAK